MTCPDGSLRRLDFLLGYTERLVIVDGHRASLHRHQHLHALSPARSPHPQTQSVQRPVRPLVLQRRLLKGFHQAVQMAAEPRDGLALTGSPATIATSRPTCRVEIPRRSAFRISSITSSGPALKARDRTRQETLPTRPRNAQHQGPENRDQAARVEAVAILLPPRFSLYALIAVPRFA